MRRHPALVALSHDHHHALVAARAARRAAAGGDASARADAARAWLAFAAETGAPHFREEEELVFPLLADAAGTAFAERAVVEHARLRRLGRRLEAALAAGDVDAALLAAAGGALEAHVRFEERVLLPHLERTAGEAELDALPLAPAPPRPTPELREADPPGCGDGWGLATADLNATLAVHRPGAGVAEHVNAERDVLLVVVAGGGTLTIDGAEHPLAAHRVVAIPRGARRALAAGPDGLRTLTAHLRRPGLEPARRLRAPGGPPGTAPPEPAS